MDLGSIHSGLQDASLAARGTHRSHTMLLEQARTLERIVDSLCLRAGELAGLAESLRAGGLLEAASSVEQAESELSAGLSTVAHSMRRWVLANEACGESLNLTNAKVTAAVQAVLAANSERA
jgi:hypothetical protein